MTSPDPPADPEPSAAHGPVISMARLAGAGLAVLVVVLVAYLPLWHSVGSVAWTAIGVGALHGLAMIGVAQWALGEGPSRSGAVRRTLPDIPATARLADLITMARSMTGSVCLAVTVLSLGGHLDLPSWWLTAVAIPTVALDAVGGAVPRRSGGTRPAAARYHLECDCMVTLVLSFGAAAVFGWWVVAIGAARYVFVMAQASAPRLRGELRPSRLRRPIGGLVMCVLVVAMIPGLPYVVGLWQLVGALLLVLVSFGRDTVGLLRTEHPHAAR